MIERAGTGSYLARSVASPFYRRLFGEPKDVSLIPGRAQGRLSNDAKGHGLRYEKRVHSLLCAWPGYYYGFGWGFTTGTNRKAVAYPDGAFFEWRSQRLVVVEIKRGSQSEADKQLEFYCKIASAWWPGRVAGLEIRSDYVPRGKEHVLSSLHAIYELSGVGNVLVLTDRGLKHGLLMGTGTA